MKPEHNTDTGWCEKNRVCDLGILYLSHENEVVKYGKW